MARINKSTKRLTLCALTTALGVVIMALGSLVDVLDLSTAAFAGFLTVLIVIEIGGIWPWLVFAATGILAFLLPLKTPALIYLLFCGWYPIIKSKIERIRSKVLQWTIKILTLNLSLVLCYVTAKYLLMLPEESFEELTAVLFILVNFAFVLCDIALTKIITLYFVKLRQRLKLDRFFK